MNAVSGLRKAGWLTDPIPYLTSALLFAAILFGGGGAEGPLQNGVIEACGALLLCGVAISHFNGKSLPREAAIPLWLAFFVLLALAMQLVPLPPELWSSLPGRETAVAVDLVTDGRLSWRPISLDPEATRSAAAALLLPLPIMLVAIRSDRRQLLWMVKALLAAALISAALGAAQVALGSPATLAPYGGLVPGTASGVFANPNHHATLMLCAIVASGILIALDDASLKVRTGSGSWRFHLAWLLIPILAVVGIAAMSRAGWALLPLAITASLLIAMQRRKFAWLAIIAVIVLALASAIFVATDSDASAAGGVQQMLYDNRLISLPDIIYTLRQYWPVGSGLGTFVPVFMANENLDLVSQSYLNHAHNDFLELLIEMGIVGAILIGAVAVAISVRLWRTARSGSPAQSVTALGGAAILCLILLHSLVDYPLRADAIAAVAGLGAGLLVTRAVRPENEAKRSRSRRRSRRGFGLTQGLSGGRA